MKVLGVLLLILVGAFFGAKYFGFGHGRAAAWDGHWSGLDGKYFDFQTVDDHVTASGRVSNPVKILVLNPAPLSLGSDPNQGTAFLNGCEFTFTRDGDRLRVEQKDLNCLGLVSGVGDYTR